MTIFEHYIYHEVVREKANEQGWNIPTGLTISIMGAMQAISYAFLGVATVSPSKLWSSIEGIGICFAGLLVACPYFGVFVARSFFAHNEPPRYIRPEVRIWRALDNGKLLEELQLISQLDQIDASIHGELVKLLSDDRVWTPANLEALPLLYKLGRKSDARFNHPTQPSWPLEFALTQDPEADQQEFLRCLLEDAAIPNPESVVRDQRARHALAAQRHGRTDLFQALQRRGLVPNIGKLTIFERIAFSRPMLQGATATYLHVVAGVAMAALGLIQTIGYCLPFTGEGHFSIASRGLELIWEGTKVALPIYGHIYANTHYARPPEYVLLKDQLRTASTNQDYKELEKVLKVTKELNMEYTGITDSDLHELVEDVQNPIWHPDRLNLLFLIFSIGRKLNNEFNISDETFPIGFALQNDPVLDQQKFLCFLLGEDFPRPDDGDIHQEKLETHRRYAKEKKHFNPDVLLPGKLAEKSA